MTYTVQITITRHPGASIPMYSGEDGAGYSVEANGQHILSATWNAKLPWMSMKDLFDAACAKMEG